MIKIRKSEERGYADHGWLKSFHTFSFAGYFDYRHMGFRSLRVLNEDRVAPGKGFGAHPHQDMEILSYVLSGSLAHKDSMGHQQQLGPNEIQKMSAGTGVVHSEFNGSDQEPVHFLQIWIEPASTGTPSSYEQIQFDPAEKQGRWKLLAAPKPEEGAARINQDAKVFVSELKPGEEISYSLGKKRYGWLQVIHGNVTLNGQTLGAGDAAAVEEEEALQLQSASGTEILFFDLA